MHRSPMPRNVDSSAHPHIAVRGDVFEKTPQRTSSAWLTGYSAVQPNAHHLRCAFTFEIKLIECISQIREELIATVEACGRREAHIVGI